MSYSIAHNLNVNSMIDTYGTTVMNITALTENPSFSTSLSALADIDDTLIIHGHLILSSVQTSKTARRRPIYDPFVKIDNYSMYVWVGVFGTSMPSSAVSSATTIASTVADSVRTKYTIDYTYYMKEQALYVSVNGFKSSQSVFTSCVRTVSNLSTYFCKTYSGSLISSYIYSGSYVKVINDTGNRYGFKRDGLIYNGYLSSAETISAITSADDFDTPTLNLFVGNISTGDSILKIC